MGRSAIAAVVGGLVAFAVGALWYNLFASTWQEAARVTPEMVAATPGTVYMWGMVAWIIAGFAYAVMASRRASHDWGIVIVGAVAIWLIGAMPATIMSTMFGLRGVELLWIDGLYWLDGILVIAIANKLIAQRG